MAQQIEITTRTGRHCCWMDASQVDGYLHRHPDLIAGAPRHAGDLIRRVIRADGTTEDLTSARSMRAIAALIGADTVDTVLMRHMGSPLHVMVCDDNGWKTETVERPGVLELMPTRNLRPINVEATRLYQMNCQPGTTHQIAGDVVICPDSDFGSDL